MLSERTIGIRARVWGLIPALVVMGMLLCSSALAQEQELEWPRQIIVSEGKIVVYQPQPETFEDNTLTGRFAASVTPEGKTVPNTGSVLPSGVTDAAKARRSRCSAPSGYLRVWRQTATPGPRPSPM